MNSIQEEFGIQPRNSLSSARSTSTRTDAGASLDEEVIDQCDMSTPVAGPSRPQGIRSISHSSVSSSAHSIRPASHIRLEIPISPRRSTRSSTSSASPPGSPQSGNTFRPSRRARKQTSMENMSSSRSSRHVASIRSSRSASSLHDEPDVPWVYHAERSVRASPSRHSLIPDEEDDLGESEDHVHAMREPRADFALRSTPGVVGLGEGWAGGPQRRTSIRAKWFKRKRSDPAEEEDPLALWTSDAYDKGEERSGPVRSLLHRSRQAFGASMSALPSFSSSTPAKGRSASMRVRRSTEEAGSPKQAVPRRPLANLFSRSRVNVAAATQSTPHLPSTFAASNLSSPKPRTKPLFPTLDMAAPPVPRAVSGPRPPWRPTSYVGPSISPKGATSEHLRNVSNNPELLPSQAQATTRVSDVFALRRTSTFGAHDIASEQGLASDTEDHPPPVPPKRQSTVGFDTIAAWAEEPKRQMPYERRTSSFLQRMRTVLTVSTNKPASPEDIPRSSTPSPLRFFTMPKSSPRPVFKSSISSPLQATHNSDPFVTMPVDEKEDLHARPHTSMGTKQSRRASWMSGSDAWLKRLSKLTEGDEDPEEAEVTVSKRHSMLGRIVPRSSSMSPSVSLRGPRMSSSASTSALTRFSTTDLNLPLFLPDQGLGLPDIIEDGRRRSIIDSLDLFPASPLQLPSAIAVDRNASIRSRVSHVRHASHPPASTTMKAASSGHSRSASDNVPGLEESNSIPTTSESGRSSEFPETPRIPTMTTTTPIDSLLKRESRVSIDTSHMSFYSAQEAGSDDDDHLQLAKADSRLSDLSADAVVGQAIKISSLETMHRHASVLSIMEMRSALSSSSAL